MCSLRRYSNHQKDNRVPIYHYKCPECGLELEAFRSMSGRNHQKCPTCGMGMVRPIGPNKPFFKVFGTKVLTNLEHDPVTFTSEKTLREYCKKKGVASGALL